ncbi:hypothetical protein DFH06DRAFT_1342948 [Mycena polygramma]|nr:hypothetical protein DFH06DRAFT_1342948 [Mycena polygramma]
MARPPPPPYEARDEYQDPVLNRLISGLSDLQVSALSSPRAPRSPPPRAPPPRTPSPTPTRLYAFSSPTRSGHTTEWSEAAHHTQGSPQGHARAIIKPRKKSRRKSNAYVVFFGVVPKVYDHWYGPNQAHEQVSGVPGSVSKGYGTRPEAEAAFAYAVARNWTGVRRRRYSSPPTPPSAIFTLPVPMSSLDPSPNPLHGSSDAPIRTCTCLPSFLNHSSSRIAVLNRP